MHADTARLVAKTEAKAERLAGAIRVMAAMALGVTFALQAAPAGAMSLYLT